MTQSKGLWKAYILAIVSITAWGFSFVWEDFLIKNNVEIFTFIFERMILAAVIMWIAGGILGKIQKIQKGDMKWMFLLGFGEPFIYFLGENFGIKYTSGVMAAIIIATIPLFCTVVDRILYKFRLSLTKVLGCFLSLLGIALFMMEKAGAGSSQLKGILLLLFFAVGGALIYGYVTNKMISRYNPMTIVTYQFSFGALLFLPFFLLFGLKGLTPEFFSMPVQSKIMALAVLCSCVCFGLWAFCTGKLGVTRVNIFSALIPLVSATASYFLYPGQETFTLLKIAGIVLTIMGVIIVQIVKDKQIQS
ncbi:MAG: DMT family transporter [Bacteroidales bacterium]|nr:DMT family transporter [Bacteroidales bacterium]